MELKNLFKEITDFEPYDFQMETMEALSEGISTVLIAPTGSGKSEVAIIPFVLFKNETLPAQMVYSLPTRTLIENLANRVQRYSSFKGLKTAIHHGKRVESSLFEESIIVTTIDQTVGAYASTPLSMPLKFGNIHAGAVSSAFLVFDEIHTFHPERGLQTTLALIEHSSKLKLPVAVMSATIPEKFADEITKRIKGNGMSVRKVVVEDESEIRCRKEREVTLIPRLRKCLNAEEVVAVLNSSSDRRLLVICNTVEGAQNLYRNLKEKEVDATLFLLHSRFLEEDRKNIEVKLSEFFGRKGRNSTIFISTQVIEVGMDISANTILTEISPIDSLIQRAGRCARWGGKGEIYVYGVDSSQPYSSELVEKTEKKLEKLAERKNSIPLNWETERKLVDHILSAHYKQFFDPNLMYEILGKLARATYEGKKAQVENTVRELLTCDVSIHDDPKSLGDEAWKLPKIKVNAWVLAHKFEKLGLTIWKIEENPIIGEDESKFSPVPVRAKEEIVPFGFYIIHPNLAYYDGSEGLVFERKGVSLEVIKKEETLSEKLKKLKRCREPWIKHAQNTLNVFDNIFAVQYDYPVTKFSKCFGIKKRELLEMMRVTVALHDIGKLNIYWQERIGWDGMEPLAHSDTDAKWLPSHAPESAVVLNKLFGDYGEELYWSFVLTIAHHHGPRSKKYKKFELIRGFEKYLAPFDFDLSFNKLIKREEAGDIGKTYIDLSMKNEYYRFYSFLSKLLRLSDWIATGGGSYESIFYC
jgi:CRISPR-associated endonuclease/helicase Cas3